MRAYDFVRPLLDSAVESGVFPSAAAAVGCKDTCYLTCAAGAADLNTRFDMASVTKVFAPTMLALRALEAGELTLDDTVSRFFDAPDDKAALTIRQLMTHTSGLPPSFPIFEEAAAPADALDCILRHPAAPADGTVRYSCIGYILLGMILEKHYHAPLDVLARERVFSPLGMLRTGYCPTGGNFAPTEVDPQTGAAWSGTVHDENARFLGGVSGNAGVFSDIQDCVRFATMLACDGGGYLSPATLRKAIANHTPNQPMRRGLGFHLAGVPGSYCGDLFPGSSYGHTGFTGTSLAVDPVTGFYAVLLTNRVHPTRANEELTRFRRVFHNRVYSAPRSPAHKSIDILPKKC